MYLKEHCYLLAKESGATHVQDDPLTFFRESGIGTLSREFGKETTCGGYACLRFTREGEGYSGGLYWELVDSIPASACLMP